MVSTYLQTERYSAPWEKRGVKRDPQQCLCKGLAGAGRKAPGGISKPDVSLDIHDRESHPLGYLEKLGPPARDRACPNTFARAKSIWRGGSLTPSERLFRARSSTALQSAKCKFETPPAERMIDVSGTRAADRQAPLPGGVCSIMPASSENERGIFGKSANATQDKPLARPNTTGGLRDYARLF